jgi:hypothetical protein
MAIFTMVKVLYLSPTGGSNFNQTGGVFRSSAFQPHISINETLTQKQIHPTAGGNQSEKRGKLITQPLQAN